MPGTCECIISQGKRDCTDEIKDFEVGRLCWVTCGEPNVITVFLVNKKRQESQQTMEAEVRETPEDVILLALVIGEKAHKSKDAGGF